MGNDQVKRISRFYSIAGILVIIFIALFMVIENVVYLSSRRVYDKNMAAVESMSMMNDTLLDVNEHVMLMVAGMGEENALEEISADFAAIAAFREQYLAIGKQSEWELRRFKHAYFAIQAYERKIGEVGPRLENARFETAHSIFEQELDPLRRCASEMITATIEIGVADAERQVLNSSIAHGAAQAFMILTTIAGIIAMFFAGRAQINRALEMQMKEEELEEASDRLVASRKKLLDSAHINILTGLQNRYGLEKRLGEILGTKQFYIAVLDLDNFRMVNDQYGYEYGDEYLIAITDRLKAQFSDRAELFNIYGNEFCLLFDDDVDDMQVKTLAEQARQSMGSNTQVAGMMLSSGVSGSLYHVLPSENADVGNVLKKLDAAMHQAKADGGNRMYYL